MLRFVANTQSRIYENLLLNHEFMRSLMMSMNLRKVRLQNRMHNHMPHFCEFPHDFPFFHIIRSKCLRNVSKFHVKNSIVFITQFMHLFQFILNIFLANLSNQCHKYLLLFCLPKFTLYGTLIVNLLLNYVVFSNKRVN